MTERAEGEAVVLRECRRQAALRFMGGLLFVGFGACAAWSIPSRRLSLLSAAAFFAVLTARYAWSLARPGYLRISHDGIEQDFGWRHKLWSWDAISEVALYKASLGNATAVLIRRKGRSLPVRLFGWTEPPSDLKRIIDGYRPEVR